ncbi:unnamed protein product [Brugia pahangi]|uniref:Ribosomal_L18e/L15P domain-containing protein n=1 Tax=Brugia pahangi TaxID=6280 RepID=A0A0N4TK47_BRUPA|nr:unnamed protein product [Brugia pahangi]
MSGNLNTLNFVRVTGIFLQQYWHIKDYLCFFRRFFSVNNLEILSHISPIASAINSPHKTISANVVYSAGSLADLKNDLNLHRTQIGVKGEIICGRETVIKTYALLKGALLIAKLVFKKINLAIAHVQMYIYFMCRNSIKIAFGYPEGVRDLDLKDLGSLLTKSKLNSTIIVQIKFDNFSQERCSWLPHRPHTMLRINMLRPPH